MFCRAPQIAPRMSSLSAALASVFLVSALPAVAVAQNPTAGTAFHVYQLEAGSLVKTLDAISAASGRHIIFDRHALESERAGTVQGNLSPRAAVAVALAGSGYVMRESTDWAIEIAPIATVQITARDEAEASFKASRSDTATRSGADLHNVPGSITLITAKVLETQQVTNLKDALRNVSGINLQQSPQAAPTFSVRGFRASSTTNGVSDNTAASADVFNVERVEVLKGPQAILSGGDTAGGGVNVVLKKPSTEIVRDLTLQYGTHADKTVAADLSGPINAAKRLSYRLIATVASASRSQAGYKGRENNSFTPSIRWKDDTTDLILSAAFSDQRETIMPYTFARRDGGIMPDPKMRFASREDGGETKNTRVNYQFEHAISSSLRVISRLQYSNVDFDLRTYSPGGLEYEDGAADNIPSSDIMFFGTRSQNVEKTLSGDHYLRYTFRTAGILHKLSVGFNHTDFSFQQLQNSARPVFGRLYTAMPIDFPDLRSAATTFSSRSDLGNRQKAVYLQDMTTYGRWTGLVGLRRSEYTTSSATVDLGPDMVFTEPANRIFKTSPSAGVVYRLNDSISLYANYAEGFVAQSALSCAGGLTPPSITKNKEAGAKFDLLDSKLAITGSVFSLEQSNYLLYEQLSNCYNVRSGQKTDGVEFDMQGRLTPNLDIVLNYTYNAIKDIGDDATVYPGYPKHKFSTWAMYRFKQSALEGLGFGIGINATSASLGTYDTDYPFLLPGQAQVDASLFYTKGPWNFTFGIKNIGDRVLYGTSSSASFVPILPRREFLLTVKRSFN